MPGSVPISLRITTYERLKALKADPDKSFDRFINEMLDQLTSSNANQPISTQPNSHQGIPS